MNEQIETTDLEPTEQAPAETQERQAEPELSLSEHEAQFPGGKKPPVVEAPAVEETPEQKTARETQQARDKETGQFKQGRRRAQSQRASAEDVPRIKELTRQLRERDEELARLRTPPPVVPTAGTAAASPGAASVAGNGHSPATAQGPKAGERYVLPAPPFDPEPQETDPKYGGDFTKYLAAVAGWNGRQAVRQSEFDRMVDAHERQQQETQQKELTDFAQRVDAAREEYEDFDHVAFETRTPIQKDSIADVFIMKDDNGPKLLYYLHSHPKELDDLLKMPELGQVKFLTLLLQRLSSTSNGSTGAVTTSVPGARTIVLPPKPPNVVRTEAQPARGGIPTDRELSLSEHEHHYAPPTRRR